MSLQHLESECEPPCPIHAPSDHHMKDWRLHWRSDRYLMERICEHGIGHPDPDHMARIERLKGEEFADGHGLHGCDGCCSAHTKNKGDDRG
ncbi:MAG TPA: hypothetical protein VD761_11875 [Solirubrobacterales bacterium]|nr:hypothetical protein [Solirubrobacterales bacterium]